MTFSILEMLMILWLSLAGAIALIGGVKRDKDCALGGMVLLVLCLVVLVAFQAGAGWQRVDTNSKYLLIEKSEELKS